MSMTRDDFRYCELCKLNHRKGKKHVYSQKHKEVVNRILDKFLFKISDGLKILEEPVVDNIDDAIEKKFWCYFCECDVSTHQTSDIVLLQFLGMISHLASDSHVFKLKRFWFRNHLDKDLLPKYYITQDTFELFTTALSEKQEEFTAKRNMEITNDAIKIQNIEIERSKLVRIATQETPCDLVKPSALPPTKHDPGVKIPPWLQDDAESPSAIIGPTKEDFDKHIVEINKLPLPAHRVGANFDHSATTSTEWLPSFGRVWTNGRRLQSKHEFTKKNKRRRIE